jgi:hypothetical protein
MRDDLLRQTKWACKWYSEWAKYTMSSNTTPSKSIAHFFLPWKESSKSPEEFQIWGRRCSHRKKNYHTYQTTQIRGQEMKIATPQKKQIIPVHVFLRNSWKHFFCSFVILSQDQGLVFNQTEKQCVARDTISSKSTYCSVSITINN